MTTANKIHAIATSVRTLVLASSIALVSVLPTAGLVYADAGSTTPPAAQPVLTADEAFDVDPAGGLFDLEAIVIAGAEGAPLLKEPAQNADVEKELPSGTKVNLRIDETDTVYSPDRKIRWWPVEVGGTTGWIDGQSLISPDNYAARKASSDGSDGTSASTSTSTTRLPFDFTGEIAGVQAQIDADGQGLSMRAEPDASSDVVAFLKEGAIVDLRIADIDTVYDAAGTRWWPVTHDGENGWVSGNYLIAPGSESQQGTAQQPPTQAPTTDRTDINMEVRDGDYVYISGDWAVVRTPDTERTNLYASALTSASMNGAIPHMALVEVLAQADGGWYEVRWDTIQGFISGDLLTAGTAPRKNQNASEPAPAPTPAPVSTETAADVDVDPMTSGDVARVRSDSGAGVNVRSALGMDGEATGFLNDGSQVDIIAGPEKDDSGNTWYQVKVSGIKSGWIRGDLLTPVIATTESSTSASTAVSESGFILPLKEYRFTQDYGCSNLGFYTYDSTWGCAVHDGLDLAVEAGTPIYAVADGTVVVSGWCNCGLGYYVEIDHGNGLHSVYGHQLEQPMVSVGQKVSQGDQIGKVGSTGLSTGPHVHFMMRKDGVTVDPKNYLPPVRTSN